MDKGIDKKPIEFIKDDLQSVIFSVEKLHNDMNELREINKDILDKLTIHLSKIKEINEDYIKVENSKKGWFF
tara:strand:+ start:194 stop:409 length:216 start_codon:yes stop_codon:yes gene_type:complete